MKRSPRPRATAELSKYLNHQLNKYAVAAGAAGVGMLAFVQPSEAKIVYTPTHVNIAFGQLYGIDFDQNHNGKADMYLDWSGASTRTGMAASDYRSATGAVAFRTSISGAVVASALRAGAKIGPERRFRFGNAGMGRRSSAYKTHSVNWFGPWANGGKGVKDRYLGVKFKISGSVHYGWARLTVTTNNNFFTEMLLTGYAYETVPNKPIIAGKTHGPGVIVRHATLGDLAAGRR
jgi:hypothetical protein